MCPTENHLHRYSSMATAEVFSPPSSPPSAAAGSYDDDDNRPCRACLSTTLYTDWSSGDRVCTSCGVIDEEKLLEDRPEWREFQEADDLAKGGPSMARSGLIVTDDTRYLGGLQPTTLSRHVYGGVTTGRATRKRLLGTNHKLDRLMEKMHSRALQTAKLSHQIRKRKYKEESETDVRPEYEQMLMKEEEDSNRVQAALYADKWSLQRAIRLYGAAHEQTAEEGDEDDVLLDDKRLDVTLLRASHELYCAYKMLMAATQRLKLPDRVIHEATTMLCRYASRRDGLAVRGVSSTLTRKPNAGNVTHEKEKEAKNALRDYNKMKQMGSLCAGLIYFTGRTMGWPRSLAEICESIQPGELSSPHLDINKDQFIKRKHCSRAMAEIKEAFPDFAQSVSCVGASASSKVNGDTAATIFMEHTIRKLQLPPVAEASIRALVVYWCQHQERQTGKVSTICTALTYFVCLTGEIMQRLALQAGKANNRISSPPSKKPRLESDSDRSVCDGDENESLEQTKNVENKKDCFDLMDQELEVSAEQRAYEMRRVWDAWQEQMPWFRTLSDLEQSCSVSRSAILEYYRKYLFPQRQVLLNVLKDLVSKEHSQTLPKESSLLAETPLAKVLLPHITVVTPLLKVDGKPLAVLQS